MKTQIVDFLMRTLYQTVGNKNYMRDVNSILNKLDLTPQEIQSLKYLAQDLHEVQINLERFKRDSTLLRTGKIYGNFR